MDQQAALLRVREAFLEARACLPGDLSTLRGSALESFLQQGFPTRKQEAWRYSNLLPLQTQNFRLAKALQIQASFTHPLWENAKGIKFAWINQQWMSHPDNPPLPEGLTIGSIQQHLGHPVVQAALSAHPTQGWEAFNAWNKAFFQDGIFIAVDENVSVAMPIYLFLTAPHAAHAEHLRHVITVGKNAKLDVITHYLSDHPETYIRSAFTHIQCEANAAVTYHNIQKESVAAFHVALTEVTQAENAKFHSHAIALGGKWARSDVAVHQTGNAAQTDLSGLYLGFDDQQLEQYTVMQHQKPHGVSRQFYKGVLGGKAKAVFNGKVCIASGAAKCDTDQQNPNLLLSRTAEVNTKPQLEIYHDDVKCTHGATVGQLREDALFYLRSRGIAESHAKLMLVNAFAEERLNAIPLTDLRESLKNCVQNAITI